MKKLFIIINYFILFTSIGILVASLLDPSPLPLLNLSSAFLTYIGLLTLIYFTISLFSCPIRKWIPITGILLSLFILWQSFYINISSTSPEKSHLSVLSYNVSFFSVKKVFKPVYYDTTQNQEVQHIREFILSHKPDVICLQEFFNDENSSIYNTIEQFQKLGYSYFLKSNPKHDNGLDRGLITFSKYPILESGIIAHSKNDYNGAVYTDIALAADKHLRIINVHLASMELYKGKRSWLNFAGFFYRAYSSATRERIKQMNAISENIENSPYQVILSGDFNDTQYSYVYRSFNKILQNAHEEKGHGLGYTFPFKVGGLGVRIDHLFYGEGMEPAEFNTFSDVKFSEHYPILGLFTFEK